MRCPSTIIKVASSDLQGATSQREIFASAWRGEAMPHQNTLSTQGDASQGETRQEIIWNASQQLRKHLRSRCNSAAKALPAVFGRPSSAYSHLHAVKCISNIVLCMQCAAWLCNSKDRSIPDITSATSAKA